MQVNFRKFIEKIKLKNKQREDAKIKAENVCRKLYPKYYEGKYDSSKSLYVGSYGKATNIRPVNDVDILFELPEELFEQYDKQKKGQSQLLQDIKNYLADKYSTSDSPKAKGTVVVIKTTEWAHNVELIPAFRQQNGDYKIPNTKDGGFWDVADYRAEIENINKSQRENNQTKVLVRILKKWNEVRSVGLKSFQIELLAIDFLDSRDVSDSYSSLIKKFFVYLKKQKNKNLIMPGTNELINIGDSWYSKAKVDLERAKKALDYEEKNKLESAYNEWKKMLGNDFPKLDVKDEALSNSEKEQIRTLTAQYPSSDEQFIEDLYPVCENPEYTFKIDSMVDLDGFRRGYLSAFVAMGIAKLKKTKKLNFSVKDCNIPQPYNVLWKVRNFGEQAARKENLRGQIKSYGREESTLYTGTHYVEAYAIKDGVCVARDIIFVPIE